QAFVTVAGFTHASNVIAPLRCSDDESGTDTNDDEPLNDNAEPNFPDTDQAAPFTVPLFPFPDPSATDDPDPSPNPQAPTSPGTATVYVAAYGGDEAGASMLCVAAPPSDQLGNG